MNDYDPILPTVEVPHSPLPWHTGPTTLVGEVWIYSERYPIAEPIGPGREWLAKVKNAFFRLRGDASPAAWKDTEEIRKAKYWATMRANAAFIVRACNCHDDLLSALKEIVASIEEWEVSVREIIHVDPKHGMNLTKAKAAIAKATPRSE
jgi:hypothetical protein